MNGMTQSKNNWDRKCNSVGWKMYMNSIQADIASRNLELYDKKKESIDAVRHLYNTVFGMDRTSGHLYRINVDNRQDFISKMEQVGIKCGIHYKACHNMSVYAGGPELPRSTNEAESTVSIPFHETLSIYDVKKVIDNVQRFAKNLRS
jgi:dTDP-4-amino-4,6-dideoxygalactose transaminase